MQDVEVWFGCQLNESMVYSHDLVINKLTPVYG